MTLCRLLLLSGCSACLLGARPDGGADLVSAAKRQIGVTTLYDPAYRRLAYPGGDVPLDRGVCTDVVIRAYRALGADLQVLVHEDLKGARGAYPDLWHMKGPDASIDHRRVPNLARFLERHGETLEPGLDPAVYLPGDLVTWRLPGGLPHIGIVAGPPPGGRIPLMIHNIGQGVRLEDILFAWRITGHYRYAPGKDRRR